MSDLQWIGKRENRQYPIPHNGLPDSGPEVKKSKNEKPVQNNSIEQSEKAKDISFEYIHL